MADELTKRAFHEDIFAEDNEKWTWPGSAPNKASGSGVNYFSQPSSNKANSSCSSSSEDDSTFRGDSNSLKRTFRKRGSSSEDNQQDISSSPGVSRTSRQERLLPSIYDDDARSGSPSGSFENKDFGFMSSFKKDFDPLSGRSHENSPEPSVSSTKAERSNVLEREYSAGRQNSKDHSPSNSFASSRNSRNGRSRKSPSKASRSERSRSKSQDKKYQPRSRTRSHSRSKEPSVRSPHRDRRRSRSRDRLSDKDRKIQPRSHRSRSRDSRRRSRSRDSRRRSRSRDSRRRSRSRDSRKRSRSRSRELRRRSRSRSYDRRRRRSYRSSSRDRYRRRRHSRSRSRSRDRSKGRSGSSNRKPGSLPLSTSGGAMTPQMALQQTMAAMSAKAQALTGIALPKYYNPAAVNPLKYAEQVQKRKLLWQSKEKVEEQPKNTVWDKLTFAQDQDGKMTAKFRKLMGIKSEGPAPKEPAEEEKEAVLKKQEELFRDLDQQYEMARMTTHTQRGVGLGYSAQTLYP
ncbi:Arginine/serine-rich coiled-coil protein 2, partial [Stegodyphus mimosarum]